jgi:hypothetical protein
MRNSVLILATALTVFSGCQKEEIVNPTATSSELTYAEAQDLNFLIQEEKLARDVYIYAFDLYGDNIFSSISSSEQTHMNAVEALLDQYDQPNPLLTLGVGEFSNATLQQLYYDLTAMVDNSLIDAYTVGATIEDLDIHDIEEQYHNTSKLDLMSTYDVLTCGSRNHLRSFYGKLQDNGASYTPQFISQEAFDAIVNSSHETCN